MIIIFFLASEYGQAIKDYREKHKLLQNELAKTLNIDTTTLNKWELKKNKPSRYNYTKIITLLSE